MANSHKAEAGGGVVVVGLIALAAYQYWPAPPGDHGGEGAHLDHPDAVAPAPVEVGIGGTYRGVKCGVSINADMEVTVELGVGSGPFAATIKAIRFSGKYGTVEFFPDRDVTLSAEFGVRTLKWSRADGFAQELGAKLTGLNGRLELGASVGVAKPGQQPRYGTLTFDGPWQPGPLPSDPPIGK